MAIKVGDKIPSVTLHYLTPEGMKSVPSDEFFAGKRVAVFGLPGAYTRTCSSRHLPGYFQTGQRRSSERLEPSRGVCGLAQLNSTRETCRDFLDEL